MNVRLSTCALCGSGNQLKLSHIVPKMVVRELKRTSIGGIRNISNPNRTVQDSEKLYMLCGRCEELFSGYEKYFSDTIFQPYIKSKKIEYRYNERLFYFLTSLSWRSLFLDLLDYVQHDVVGLDALECLIASEKTMRDFLLGRRSDVGNIEHHMFFFDKIQKMEGDIKELSMNPHAIIHRGITSFCFCDEEHGTYGTFTNMMGIIVVTLYRRGKEEVWMNTEIINGAGTIKARNQYIVSTVMNVLVQIMRASKNAADDLYSSQQKIIKERLKESDISIVITPIFQDWLDDNRITEST